MAALGSCRTHGPLAALADRGSLRFCAQRPIFFIHTATEALQILRIVAGERGLSEALSPYVFGTKAIPSLEPFRLAMRGDLDAFLVEISHDRQFVHGDTQLQAGYLSAHLVRPRGSALLPWFRELCAREGEVSESTVEAALETLRRSGREPDALTIDLMRHTRMERHGRAEIVETLGAIRSRLDGRLVVVGHIEVQGHVGAVMNDRRVLNAKLREAAAGCGADFFDPSPLVAKHGRAVALENGGADIYEYAPDFRPIVGEALLAAASGGRSGWTSQPRRDAGPAQLAARSQLAETVDRELSQLHRDRLARMGENNSGLYNHYSARLERGQVIEPRERAVVELIHGYLPAYATYGVLRAGLGELALLLAASGRTVIAHEPNPNRRSAIVSGLDHLQAAGLIGKGSLTVSASPSLIAPVAAKALGIGLNVGLTPRDPDRDAILAALATFDALLIDPGHFFRLSGGETENPPPDETLASLGFIHRRDYPADGLAWFRRSGAVSRPPGRL